MRPRRRLALLALIAGVALPADAEPVVHEYLPPDPSEDLALGATTHDGRLPAAMRTAGGAVAAPDPERARASRSGADASSRGAPGAGEGPFHPDRDTRRPDLVAYDDPFTPSVAPYARLRAFDAVLPDGSLAVRDGTLRKVPVGGELRPEDDGFYLDAPIDLEAGEAVRIASPGPGARALRVYTDPEVPFELTRDGADGWFVRGPRAAHVRLLGQIAVPRASFAPALGRASWNDLRAPALPPGLAREAAEVARSIGVSREQTPAEATAKLVTWARSFEPGDAELAIRRDAYLDIATSRQGVCRHRAYVFVVTALGLGLPARMIANEAHAWVEVSDGRAFHRIDLGGAARELAQGEASARVAHVAPPDPYPWPSRDDSGQALALAAAASAPAGSADVAAARAPVTPDDRTPSRVSIDTRDLDARRGEPVTVRGEVRAGGGACAGVRVDVALTGAKLRAPVVLGALATDAEGRYEGTVTVPKDAPLGDFDLVVSTPGDARCGAGDAVAR